MAFSVEARLTCDEKCAEHGYPKQQRESKECVHLYLLVFILIITISCDLYTTLEVSDNLD